MIVPHRMLDGPVDRARLNGRCTLTGGEIVEHESSAGPKDWDLRTIGRRRPGTDVVTYRREIGATERVRLSNRPAIGGTPSEFSQLDEFTAMCGVFDEQPEPFPVTLPRRTRRTRIGALVTFPDAEELRGADKVSAICSLVSDV